jgi:isopenicillin-N N-acyltransferase-like protein
VTTLTVPLVRAAGTPFEVGYQHGLARAADLRAFLADDLARISRLAPAPVTLAELEPELAGFAIAIANATPALSEELAGLADGAQISAAEAVLLQARRELIGYQKIPVPARGDCTTYASLTGGPANGPVLAQTVDLNGDLDDQLAVLEIDLSGSKRRSLVLSFGGLLGYLGLNSDGLAIGLNLVLGGDWHPGLPPYLAIRHLLDQASNVKDALTILAGLPLASSRSLTLCDPVSVACVELLDGELRVTSSGPVSTHTNHFLHQDFKAADELNVFARNSSVRRLKAVQAGLDQLGEPASVEQHFDLLSSQGICVADTGDLRREKTVAAVVMLPDQGELHVRPGNPNDNETHTFRIGAR